MRKSSDPIPIPQNKPSELHKLIADKYSWLAVIERCATHPNEVGSSHTNRNDKGYTALHMVTAYNHGTDGKVLVPVIKAILKAADDIDYAAAYVLGTADEGSDSSQEEDDDENRVNINEIVEGDVDTETAQQQLTRGSWRLLFDQNNRARWAPIHLISIQGGIIHGKVAVIKALLQVNDDEDNGDDTTIQATTELNEQQKQMLSLLDRQNRNILHHLLDSVVPSNETFDAVRFIVSKVPTLLFQRDTRDKTPLQYVLERIIENPGSRRRHYMNSYGNDGEGIRKNYEMLKLLVECMERETREWNEDEIKMGMKQVRTSAATGKDDAAEQALVAGDVNDSRKSNERLTTAGRSDLSRNVLHLACLLPKSVCPPDGSLPFFLCSKDAFKLETEIGPETFERCQGFDTMAAEKDADGNTALSLYASNKSYACMFHPSISDERSNSVAKAKANGSEIDYDCLTEWKVVHEIHTQNINAVSSPNNCNELPLCSAMKANRTVTLCKLLLEYPKAVLLDDSMDSIKLFMHALSHVAVPVKCLRASTSMQSDFERRRLTNMFYLVRSRPDAVALAGSNGPQREDSKTKKKQWWKRLNPFSSIK